MSMKIASLLLLGFCTAFSQAQEKWTLGKATKLPSEFTNQESGYFSIVEGLNGRVYIGAAKYGVNAYLLEYDPRTDQTRMVVDAHKVIGTSATGFAAQSKFHTRNNVGESGRIYVATKQGYPDKGESRDLYPGGYAMAYDPKTGVAEHFGIAYPKHGIISITPDESRGLAYISTCSDDRPIDHTRFMVLDMKTKKYTDLGDLEHPYAFIVVDHLGRALHPVRGGTIARYNPDTRKLDKLRITIDGKEPPKEITKDGAILNWDISPDRKTLWSVEMSTNQVFAFDLTAGGEVLPGRTHGKLLSWAKQTDCRAMCVGSDGMMWAAVTVHGIPDGPILHLVSAGIGKAPLDHGPLGVANPNFTTFEDASGKQKPWHHTMPKRKGGVLSPWQPMGVCASRDGSAVYVLTIAPFTLMRFERKALGR